MKKIGLLDVKSALNDSRFRESLPAELIPDVTKYLQNPSCACNVPIYKRILKLAKEQLKNYFPGLEIGEDIPVAVTSGWMPIVINCHIDELEKKLRELYPGHKQIAIGRYEDQVTVVVNDV